MKAIIGLLIGVGLLLSTIGCEVKEEHYHRGGYYHGYYGEYPEYHHGHGHWEYEEHH